MSDGICISETQRRVHIVSEAAALAVVAPFTLWLATRRELPTPVRALSGAIGVTTLVVDGLLLTRFLNHSPKSAGSLGSTSRSHLPSPRDLSGRLSHPLFP
jgi:hypothetical protein